MKYCSRCILPDTRPGIVLGPDGACSGCRTHGTKRTIDWAAREKAWRAVVAEAKARGRGHDCVIPVSGGKDSTWQVLKCLEHGLNPLAVTWKTPARTAVGARNLANLVALGVDHIDYQVNPKVERKLLYRSLVRFGATAVPMHLALFAIPLTIAARFGIPLVVWGENSALEYGGSDEDARSFKLDAAWLAKYGVTHGTTARDWISDELTEKELTPYFGPSDAELEAAGVSAVFLGQFFEWDVATSLAAAKAHGFETRREGPKTGIYDFADIDDDFISIHHWLKWLKFGMTRSFDNLSLEIRNGRLGRDAAIERLRRIGDETPHEDIARFCEFVGITRAHFDDVCERFRNLGIWVREGGTWRLPGFLIADWKWLP